MPAPTSLKSNNCSAMHMVGKQTLAELHCIDCVLLRAVATWCFFCGYCTPERQTCLRVGLLKTVLAVHVKSPDRLFRRQRLGYGCAVASAAGGCVGELLTGGASASP